MKLKTKFCDRFFNLSPRIVIYDLDGTIIDSTHRIKLHENGSLDLEHWKQNSTKEQIFKDIFFLGYFTARLFLQWVYTQFIVKINSILILTKWDCLQY